MNRIMIALCSLILSFSVVGCVLEGDELVEAADDSIAAESFDELVTLQNEQEQPLSGAASGDAQVTIEADEDYGTEGCWVVLEWCDDPFFGGPTCSASGTTCTIQQIEYHCSVLVRQYC